MNELREEIELPALGLAKVNGEYSPWSVIEVRERQLLSSLAANREQKATLADRDNHIDLAYKALGDVNRSVYLFDHIREQKAEIDRMTALNKQLHEANFRQAAKINSIVGARAEFADTLLKLFGYTMYTEEYENASIVDEVKAAIVRADKAEAELASLRTSVGEKWIEIKPDMVLNDAMEVGRYMGKKWVITRLEHFAEGWSLLPPNDFYTHYRKLAPPNLPGEEK